MNVTVKIKGKAVQVQASVEELQAVDRINRRMSVAKAIAEKQGLTLKGLAGTTAQSIWREVDEVTSSSQSLLDNALAGAFWSRIHAASAKPAAKKA